MAGWAGVDELGDSGEGGEDREEQSRWAGAGLGGIFWTTGRALALP